MRNDERFLIKERPPKNNARDILDIENKLSEIKKEAENVPTCDVTFAYIHDLREKLSSVWNLMLAREVQHPEVDRAYKSTRDAISTLEKTHREDTSPIRLGNKMVTFSNR